jgi:hypothetical protein
LYQRELFAQYSSVINKKPKNSKELLEVTKLIYQLNKDIEYYIFNNFHFYTGNNFINLLTYLDILKSFPLFIKIMVFKYYKLLFRFSTK